MFDRSKSFKGESRRAGVGERSYAVSSLWLVSPLLRSLLYVSSFLSHPEDRSLLHWLYFCIPASPSSPPSRSSSTCARPGLRGFLIDTGVFTPAGRAKAPLIGLRLVSATFYRRLQLTADFFVVTSVSRADAAPHLVVARVRGFEFVPFWSLG